MPYDAKFDSFIMVVNVIHNASQKKLHQSAKDNFILLYYLLTSQESSISYGHHSVGR